MKKIVLGALLLTCVWGQAHGLPHAIKKAMKTLGMIKSQREVGFGRRPLRCLLIGHYHRQMDWPTKWSWKMS